MHCSVHSPDCESGIDRRYFFFYLLRFPPHFPFFFQFSSPFLLHYVRDTGRVDSNLGPLPILNSWGPGLGKQVRTPGTDFAPELGVAWDLGGNGEKEKK